MAINIDAIKKAANAAVDKSNVGNMHESKSTERSLPAQGKALARLVGVVEIGEHEVNSGPNIAPKIKNRIRYVFELFGKKYPRHELDDGTVIPQRLSRSITNSRHEKSTQYAWVSAMDPAKQYNHPIQMIGDSFIVHIEHKQVPDGTTIAYIKAVEEATHEDLDTGEVTKMEAPEPVSDYMIFLWSNPSLEMWNSLYIPGEFDGRSRNIFQDMITNALNFEGSPAALMLQEAITNGEHVTGLEESSSEESQNAEEPAKQEDPAPQPEPAPQPTPTTETTTPQSAESTQASAETDDDEETVSPQAGTDTSEGSDNQPQGKVANRLATLMGTT